MRIFLGLLLTLISGSAFGAEAPIRLRLWHQLIYSHREVQAAILRDFEKQNPGIRVDSVYYETEQLRSSFQSAAQVGGGPELIYGPSDQVGPLATMRLLAPLEDVFTAEELQDFDPLSLIRANDRLLMIGDNVGNHLALLYNRKLIAKPPADTDELFRQGSAFKKGFFLVWPMQEPFFFVPWVAGFGEPFVNAKTEPRLDTPALRGALAFVKRLKDSGFVPREADYETANALFKDGKAAMIINGDWSWGDYKKAGIDFGVARLPRIRSTGLWPSPLVAAKGYSINAHLKPEKREAVRKLLRYLLSKEVELRFTAKVSTLPSRLSARQSPIVTQDPWLRDSASVMQIATPMPIAPELRAIWDVLRTHYQAVLAGSETPDEASAKAQTEAVQQIKVMNEVRAPDSQAWIVKGLAVLLTLVFLTWILRHAGEFQEQWNGPLRLGYLFLLPAVLIVAAVIVFPFFYNLTISFSNFSLRSFHDWQITGFQNYTEVLTDPAFYQVFAKTLLWTGLNLFFHVSLGLALALLIDQTLPAKPLWRTLLIIPWAVPQYITALTWRGMFNEQFGAINNVLTQFLHVPAIAWLSKPLEAFLACLLTNVWLGFPFMMMVCLGGLQAIPKELYEAARVDGANAWQRFVNITWPLLQPVLVPAIVLGGIWTFNNLNVIWLVSNGGEPANQTHILVSYVYKSAFDLYRYGSSAALSMLIFLMLLGATLLYLRVSERKISAGGVK